MAGYDGGLDPRQPRDLKVPEYTLGVGLLLNFIGDESFIRNNMLNERSMSLPSVSINSHFLAKLAFI